MTSSTTPREKFQSLLRELFQIEAAAELDFGIYRIMGQKRETIEKFINQELLDTIDAELNSGALKRDSDTTAQLEEIADQIRDNIADDAIDPEGTLDPTYHKSKLGKQYLALQEKANPAAGSAESHEATIYNHLYHFFSRYYDNGDFLSLRRYSKNEKYAIPYNGEEVYLHWANADQYYIKTGETFTDYRFKNPSASIRVRFTVTSANVPQDNIKAPDKRFFLPQTDALTVETIAAKDAKNDEGKHTLVTLPFHYRGLTAEELKTLTTDAEEKKLKGAAATKPQAAALAIAADSLPALKPLKSAAGKAALAFLTSERHQDADGKPVSHLAHHLRRFSVKNTSDYFIHKDLGAFLTRELDFFIKNEVLKLDSLEATGSEARAEGWFQLLQTIRRIGSKIIAFLHQLENFQKRLFEKKKFVTDCHYCLTLDRIPQKLWPEIAKNKQQTEEWKKLFAIDEVKGWSEPPTTAFLKKNQNLVVDTGLFEGDVTACLVGELDDQDESQNGLLINSENYQALHLGQELYHEKIKCTYIDPPYNTGDDGFAYKDTYQHSSWMSMITDRLALIQKMTHQQGVLYSSIDEGERSQLEKALELAFGKENRVEEIIWAQNTTKNQSPTYSTNHEYVAAYAKSLAATKADPSMFRESKPGLSEIIELTQELEKSYPAVDKVETAIRELFKKHKEDLKSRKVKNDDWKGIYNYNRAEYRDEEGQYIPEDKAKKMKAAIWVWREVDTSMPQVKKDSQKQEFRDPDSPAYRFYRPIHPVTKKECPPPKTGWRWPHLPHGNQASCFRDLAADNRIAWGEDENKVPQRKSFLHEVETNVAKSVLVDFTDGEKELERIFGHSRVFGGPKPTTLPARFCDHASLKNHHFCDFFAGSGTSGEAVISYNREHEANGRFLLIEMGDHFDTVLIPRLKKVIYSADWKSGKPLTRDTGISHCFKYLRLESYEDALGNIAFNENEAAQRQLNFDEYCINYMLAFETGQSETLLNVEKLTNPFDYKLEIRDGDESTFKNVDLPETFNFLLGLRVRTRRVLHRTKGGKKLKYLVLRGRTNPHATGGEREVVCIWRTTAGWTKADFTADRTFIEKEKLTTDADEIFLNSDSTVKGAKSIDPIFKRRMFNEE